jgi:hypothetical protein
MQNYYEKSTDPPLLNYSVIGSSSEDDEHPLYSLISPDKNDGWCSSPFCKYPQEILIQLNNPSKLSQMNITLHEYKIPSKIDFYYYYPNQKNKEEEKFDYNNIPFIKIGYIIPNTNEKSNFKLREFKKIKINQNTLYIKLILHKNFINLENRYNQVSIISIKFFGYELENSNPPEYKNLMSGEMNKNKNSDFNEDGLDEVCVSKLKEIKSTLDLCVKKEKYDSAKIFRELYQRVKLLGEKMKNLSECKLKCIETNDFDSCKKIQNDIDRIKNLIGEINANFIDDEDEKNNNDEKKEDIEEDPFK